MKGTRPVEVRAELLTGEPLGRMWERSWPTPPLRFGPIQGTNNIGEFLAIVHGLPLSKQQGWNMPIYSDSVSGMAWVRNRKAKTTLARTEKTAQALDLVARAENWLRENGVTLPVLKWDTEQWGEIPADFGRK